jgi:hypothetical protein
MQRAWPGRRSLPALVPLESIRLAEAETLYIGSPYTLVRRCWGWVTTVRYRSLRRTAWSVGAVFAGHVIRSAVLNKSNPVTGGTAPSP